MNCLAIDRPDIMNAVKELARRMLTDSDWAGCHVIRRSTSGGCAMAGAHFIKA